MDRNREDNTGAHKHEKADRSVRCLSKVVCCAGYSNDEITAIKTNTIAVPIVRLKSVRSTPRLVR